MKPDTVIQIVDGTWYALGDFQRDICCGCGLVHDMFWKMEKGRIFFSAKVNTRETNKHRTAHGIKVTRKS